MGDGILLNDYNIYVLFLEPIYNIIFSKIEHVITTFQ
jgi:hypothetical protein